jgi:hypothetical protein
MWRMYVGKDMGVSVWAGCIWVSMEVLGNGHAVSRSGYVCEGMGLLYIGQDRRMSIWADCI